MNLPHPRRRPAPAVTPHENHRKWRAAALWLDYPGMRTRDRRAVTATDTESGSARDDSSGANR